jgi:hypothetical protein
MSGADFDFLFGVWDVAHRRLKTRLAGRDDWQDFAGACECRPILNGLGNIDDNLLHLPAGAYRAATLRAFNLETGLWSIWWLDGRFPDRLDVPVVGKFDGATGTFYADDHHEGRAIRVRFTWTRAPAQRPRWEQTFSADAGLSWETNWVMAFSQRSS